MDTTSEEWEAQRTFARLKPLCSQLLDVSSTSSQHLAVVLERLRVVLKEDSGAGLQRCMDYALFPLLHLLDAAVAGRSSTPSTNMPFSGKDQIIRVGDQVAEGVLMCVSTILQRCVLESSAQVTVMLQKLAAAAMLSATEASEEFRHGVVTCLQCLLHSLSACDNSTCKCKSVSSSPFVALAHAPVRFCNEGTFEQTEFKQELADSEPCPLGYLQSERMSVVIGHLISLLLQISEGEVTRGAVGSGKLRRDALFTLRTLNSKVGTADGLAFFLPGVASRLGKVMNSSRGSKVDILSSVSTGTIHTSGAAGWPGAVEEAVKGLTEMLVIVLSDKRNASVLNMSRTVLPLETDISDTQEHVTAGAALESLQGLSVQLQKSIKGPSQDAPVSESTRTNNLYVSLARGQQKSKRTTAVARDPHSEPSPFLRSERNKEWLDCTTSRVNALLAQTFPLLCAHQSSSVRMAVTEAAAIILATCTSTLMTCTAMLLECLLALACDDWDNVASAAQTYLTLLLAPSLGQQQGRTTLQNIDEDTKQLRLNNLHGALARVAVSTLDDLPTVVFSANMSFSVLHVRRLAAAMYFLGPEGVSVHLMDTVIAKQKFIQTLSQCLGFNTTFTGSLHHILSSNPQILGPSVSELKLSETGDDLQKSQNPNSRLVGAEADELPIMPPWLSLDSGGKVYHVLACVLRLAGLSTVTDDCRGSFISLMELVLVNVRQAAGNVKCFGVEAAEDESKRGLVRRMAATSVCLLNEIIYGASGAWNEKLFSKFGDRMLHQNLRDESVMVLWGNTLEDRQVGNRDEVFGLQSVQRRWVAAGNDEVMKLLSECASDILHDYLAKEIWDQPVDSSSASLSNNGNGEGLQPIYAVQDNAMLQKVLVEGIGVLGIALGKAFEDAGYLGLVLFPLLEKLACPNKYVRGAAAISLTTICLHCKYATVRELIVANVDLVIDSLCRQFRHLEMYPNASNLLAVILHQTNASADLLPLLEEPLRGVVLELDVLARRSHPHFTVPLLRALREIARATKAEARDLVEKTADASVHYKCLLGKLTSRKTQVTKGDQESDANFTSFLEPGRFFLDSDLEEFINIFVNRRRCRQAVIAIATSCLVACGPLLASRGAQPCLLALDIVEDGIATLSQAEEAAVNETKEKDCIQHLCEAVGYLRGFDDLISVGSKNEIDSKKLLPSMNQIWPQLVLTLKHLHTSVKIRGLAVISSVTVECGGNFFTRRFQKDAVPVFVRLLREGTLSVQRKSRSPALLMPGIYSEIYDSAPATVLKVQETVLKCITLIAASEKSASALDGSFGFLAACVIVFACRVEAIREVATDAVLTLSRLDPDLIWIILADLAYGCNGQELNESIRSGLPTFNTIFPAYKSPKDALCLQYADCEVDEANLSKIAAKKLLAKVASF